MSCGRHAAGAPVLSCKCGQCHADSQRRRLNTVFVCCYIQPWALRSFSPRNWLSNCLAMPLTHTGSTALFPGLPRWAGTSKVKPIWILLKQETVSGSGISWAICKSAPRSRQTTTLFFQDRCPSCRPTKALKPGHATVANKLHKHTSISVHVNTQHD